MTKTDYSKLVKAPAPSSINTGLSACRMSTLIGLLGVPGKLTRDCSPVTNAILKRSIVTMDVGPFKLTGHKKFLLIVADLYAEVFRKDRELFDQVRTAGCLCCRQVRGVPGSYSNHSFGTAKDVYFGPTNDVVGDGKCQLGLLALYPYAHERGLYWGAEFGKSDPKREDSMHWEVSDELAHELFKR